MTVDLLVLASPLRTSVRSDASLFSYSRISSANSREVSSGSIAFRKGYKHSYFIYSLEYIHCFSTNDRIYKFRWGDQTIDEDAPSFLDPVKNTDNKKHFRNSATVEQSKGLEPNGNDRRWILRIWTSFCFRFSKGSIDHSLMWWSTPI